MQCFMRFITILSLLAYNVTFFVQKEVFVQNQPLGQSFNHYKNYTWRLTLRFTTINSRKLLTVHVVNGDQDLLQFLQLWNQFHERTIS